ncbi:MAG: hypothetical protein RL328_2659 [Acidobacteriota bacterium]|jgi:hypothetical protein
MFCDRCGTKLAAEAAFCPSCGKQFGAGAPKRGLAQHLKILGILWIIHGCMHILPGLALMFIFQPRVLPQDVPPFVFNFMPFLGALLTGSGALCALVGSGLLMRQRWARIPALILAGLNLLSIPFGTALGIYTFWALLPSEHEQEYRELTQAV